MIQVVNSDLTSSVFTGSVEFLKYGPLGLAGLMLVLVLIALFGNLSETRARLIRLFLYVGSFCFVVASASVFLSQYVRASHMLHLRIEPTDMGQTRTLPPPIVTINSNILKPPLNYLVYSETTAIIDVSDAIAQSARQQQALSGIMSTVDSSVASLEQVKNFALADGCPGGAHGIAIPHGGEMAALSSTVISNLRNTKAAIQTAIPQTLHSQ